MSLTPFERRRAYAVLVVAAVLLVACLATGAVVVAVAIVVLTPAAVYRVTGHRWRQAFAWASGRESVLTPHADRGGARGPREAGPRERAAAIAVLVAGVPAALGLLSALVGRVVDAGDATLALGMIMTLSWTGFAALLSGLVTRSGANRKLIALGAGAATALSVVLWTGVVGGA